MNILKTKSNDQAYLLGLVLLALSLLCFCGPFLSRNTGEQMGLFACNFSITAIYFFTLLFSGRLKKGRNGLHLFNIFLVLFLISAYALNREMTVFEDSASWLACLLILTCINYLAFYFWERYPAWLLHIMHFLLGTGFVLFVYLSFYLIPLYAMSVPSAIVLGISLHTFVPLLFCIYTIVLLRRTTVTVKSYQASFYAGITTVMIITSVFIVRWSTIVNTINTTYNRAIAADDNGLPPFVSVAEAIPQGWIEEEVLQSDLVYNIPSGRWDDFFWRMPTRNFGEVRKHDPLVMVAALLTGTPKLSDDERIKILESVYDSRHKAQNRLWSGKHLVTDNIHTSVQVWPALHISYTEKVITVTNNAFPTAWPREEEAIYTFHLPEGSVVSALSLWIKGREEKGIVTTKEKADSAYTEIVGYERRDPSVVHWQEGNTVTVRVFPVIAGESRTFKLGITSPLSKQADSLLYENIYFDGPAAASAKEQIRMDFQSSPKNLVTEASFESGNNRSFTHTGTYNSDWKILFKDEGIAANTFSFDGISYSLAPYQVVRAGTDVHDVYLDINSSWTKDEFYKVYDAVKYKHVYVYDQRLLHITESNKDYLFESLSRLQFSIFPLYTIKDPAASMLVSKSCAVSPNMHDLEDSPFMTETKEFLQKGTTIKLFNIGTDLSPYLKSLKEFRAFTYEHGTTGQLQALIVQNKFATSMEDDHRVIIDNAGLVITASAQTTPSTAPDHLMRLFTYNHLMQKAGARLFTDSTFTTGLTEEASKAGIVTPVSSLVVLETQADYDRFDIKQSANSLKNASLKSKGAVPEPHEWALIIIALSALFYVKYSFKKIAC